MFCMNCGNQLPDDACFCNKCGKKVEVSNVIICPNCGRKQKPYAKFCASCGSAIGYAAETRKKDLSPEVKEKYKRAVLCYESGDYTYAYQFFKPAAEHGNTDAQLYMGKLCNMKRSIHKDEAIKWYTMAAEGENSEAQLALGLMYLNGEGVARDYPNAINWISKSSEQGDVDAQYLLGKIYYRGMYDTPKDERAAKELFDNASSKGNNKAKVNLAAMETAEEIKVSGIRNGSKKFDDKLIEFIKKVIPIIDYESKSYYIYFNSISEEFEKKLGGALTYANIGRDTPFVIVDSALFGSAKSGALFTNRAVYINETSFSEILYSDVTSIEICNTSKNNYGIKINGKIIHCMVNKYSLIELLRDFFECIVYLSLLG